MFEGSTLVSASFCRVLHCLAVLQNGIRSKRAVRSLLRSQTQFAQLRFGSGSSEKGTAARALLFTVFHRD